MYCIYTIGELLENKKHDILNNIKENIDIDISEDQIVAWDNQIEFLKNHLIRYNKNHYIIFEYTLIEGKRPDIIILTDTNVLILEFKTGPNALDNIDAHLEQTYNYKNRISQYHVASRELNFNIESFLVFSHRDAANDNRALNKDDFNTNIDKFLEDNPISYDKLQQWVMSPYQAIPSILEAVSNIFTTGKLPDVMKSKTDINNTLSTINDYIENPKNKIQIIFVSGEPGSGKTLLGLSIVNEYKGRARFLTGNGPLSKVLKYQIDKATGKDLSGESFIGHLTNWIKDSELKVKLSGKGPGWKENIFVFDEAQRAWNHKKNKASKRSENSQPEQIIKLLLKESKNTNNTMTLICLIGNGQEIHLGEEDGIDNWLNAIRKVNESNVKSKFQIMAPKCIADYIRYDNVQVNDSLYLDKYFRGYEEDLYPKWVNALLDWNEKELKDLTEKLNNNYYPLYITRTLSKAKKHIKNRYKTYGLCVSCAGKSQLRSYCEEQIKSFNNSRGKSNFNSHMLSEVEELNLGEWFSGECNNLKTYTTEFNSQGLEIDFEIFPFTGDLELDNGKWKVNKIIGDFEEKDKLIMSKNKHRVLLTRGREGIILWLPDIDENKELYGELKRIGVKELI